MIQFKFDKGRLKIGKHSLSNLAIAEALAAGTFLVLTIILGWSGWKDLRTYYAWNGALRDYSSNLNPSSDLEVAIANRPEFLAAHLLRAKVAMDAGDYPRAQQEYETVMKLDPANEAAVVGQGVLSVKMYDKTKQEPNLAAAKASFSQASGNADAKVGLGHILLRQGELNGAYQMFEGALATDPPASIDGMSDLYIGMGAIAIRRKNPAVAREYFERAQFLTPGWDRGYANAAYLMAQQMAETPVMDREKFKASSRMWTDFATLIGNRYAVNKDARPYYKDAILTYLDAYACLALRSLDGGSATSNLAYVRGLDRENKRPTLNYIATLTQVIYNKTLTFDEQRLFLSDLGSVTENAFTLHKDLSSREQAVLYQVLACRYSIDRSDLGKAERLADSAKEQYLKGGEDTHLLAMIERVSGTAIWKAHMFETDPAKKLAMGDRALKAFKESLKAEPDQPDLQAWMKRVENGGN
ncbi:MAG: hypothetical protein K8T20_01555 [Planctomycetes bacterium]|nr:hypothetical protein [Planctomycetota bacterium]